MITLTKAIEKRCTALKYMQQNVDWGAREVTSKFGISSSFISLATKKGIIKKEGSVYRWNSTVDANARMADALLKEERRLQREYKRVREEKKASKIAEFSSYLTSTNTNPVPTEPIKEPVKTISLSIVGKEVIMDFDDFVTLIRR